MKKTAKALFSGSCMRLCAVLFLFSFLSAASAPALSGAETAASVPAERKAYKDKTPTREMASITAVLARLAVSQHYAGRPLDAKFSETAFNEYLKRLDPMKMFFLQSDLQSFSEYRTTLAERLLKGNVDFAFDAFNLMVRRMREYQDFAETFLKTAPSLVTEEEISLERDKEPWPATQEEMRAQWRKKLLYELILLNMADRAAKEEGVKNEEETDDGETKAKTKTPEERIRLRIARTLHHFEELEPIEVLEIYLTSMLQVFDPHSSYMSPRSNEQFDIEMSLSLVGIGAVLTSEDGYVKIVEIMPGGPAEKQGELKAGDRIIAVRQEHEKEPVDVIDMPLDKVVGMIRGKANTKVTLTVLKAGKGLSGPRQITITRAKVELKESAAHGKIQEWNGKKYGVIVLPSFYLDFNAAKLGNADYRSASADVRKILIDFQKKNPDLAGVVIDLRSNGGGSLHEAIALTGLLIKEGPVVQVRDRRMTSVEKDEDDGEIVYNGPLAVMVNRFSASSSEIFAAAIRDYGRGVLIGDGKTHGKGTVQFVADLDRYMPYLAGRRFPAGSIRLTNAKFYRINGESTQLKGVTPDIVLPSLSDCMDVGEDKLEHALAWDVIGSSSFETFRGPFALNDEKRAELRRRSAERVNASPDFRRIRRNIEEFKAIRDRKSIVLNLDERWKEYERQKDLQKEQDELQDMATRRSSRNKETREKKHDVYLEEALNILSDLREMP